MDPRKLFIDERVMGVCAYCGATADSRDHVPSKVLLDEPYPENLSVAESCAKCNQGFSASEEYLACLIECVKNGSSVPNDTFRPKIAAILAARPGIAQRIEAGKRVAASGEVTWRPEDDRVREVVLKLARGHITYELGIQRTDEPVLVEVVPIPSISNDDFQSFLEIMPSPVYPEIGSRSFLNSLEGKVTAYESWRVVQEDNYQYAVGQGAGDWVKMIIGSYLVGHVTWG